MRQYQRLQTLWLGNDAGDLSVTRQYTKLSDEEIAAIKSLREYADARLTAADTLSGIAEQIKSLDTRQNDILNSWQKVAFHEHTFIRSLWILEKGLDGLRRNLTSIKDQCQNTPVAETITKAADDAEKWALNIAVMRASVTENQTKRPIILVGIMSVARLNLQTEFANRAGLRISDLQSKIDQILAGSTLLGDMRYWWVNHSYTGSNTADTAYLRYLEPMRAMAADEGFLDDFGQKANSITTSDDMRRDITAQLSEYRKVVDGRMAELKQKGWQGQFDRQKFLVERREANINQYSALCQSAIRAFDSYSPKVTTIDTFQTGTDRYHEVVDQCNGGTP